MRIYSFLLFFFSLLLANNLLAQNSPINRGGQTEGNSSSSDSLSIPEVNNAPDTFNFHFLYPANPDLLLEYKDTTIHHFQNHDPVRQQEADYGMTGNLGGAHFPFLYKTTKRRGFEVGFQQFDLYKTQYDQFAFYRLRKAFTNLHFSQGKTQQDTYTKAAFSRNFANNINLSVDFKRISNAGQYQSQKSENTSLLVGLWYKSQNRRYDAFVSFVSNTIFQQENGGVNKSGLNNTNIEKAILIPLKLSSGVANTAHTGRSFHYQQRFLFNKQRPQKRKSQNKEILELFPIDTVLTTTDSLELNQQTDSSITKIDSLLVNKDSIDLNIDSLATKVDSLNISNVDSTFSNLDSLNLNLDSLVLKKDLPKVEEIVFRKRKRDFAFSHHGEFEVSKYKFSDTSPASDSSYYGDLQIDSRGLRYFIRDRKLENSFTLNTSKLQKKGGAKVQKQKDFFEVGIRHSIHFLHQEPRDTVINNLFLKGRWDFAPGERLKIQTYADLGLIDNAGDYHMSGDLFFDLKNAGSVKAKVIHQSYSPTLIQQEKYVSQKLLWKNDLSKTFETSIGVSYKIPRFHLELIGQYHLLDHFIYFNAEARPQQYNSPLSIGQLRLKKDFRFWFFVLENDITFQQVSKSILRLPQLYSKHSFYFAGKIFKRVLNIQIGADLRINTPYEAPGYQPLTGQFYLQEYAEGEEETWYPDIDVFINFKVQNFRFFAKQENVFGYFTNNLHYQVKDYALVYPSLRFGVSWQFLD